MYNWYVRKSPSRTVGLDLTSCVQELADASYPKPNSTRAQSVES